MSPGQLIPADQWVRQVPEGLLQAIAAGIERAFPLTSRRTLVSLIDVDPEQFQAQWQVEPGHLALVLGAFPPGQAGLHQRLRLVRLDGSAQEIAILDLPAAELGAQGVARFLVVEGADLAYQAELGLVSPEGGWLLLGRSSPARLPESAQPIAESASRPSPSGPLNWPALAGEESAEDRILLSPPWDPTLAEPGYPLEPRFPLPSRPLPHKSGTGGGEGLERRRLPLPGWTIPPLVIARTLGTPHARDDAGPPGIPHLRDGAYPLGIPNIRDGAGPQGVCGDANSPGADLEADWPTSAQPRNGGSPSAGLAPAYSVATSPVAVPLGDASSPGSGLGAPLQATVPRLRSPGCLPSFSRPWGEPASATGCWLFDYEPAAEVSAGSPAPEPVPGTPQPA